MERYEMAELLSQKAGVTLEEARQALADNDWDMLDAMVALERACRAEEPSATVTFEGEDDPEGDVRPVKNVSGHKGQSFFTNGFAVIWSYIKKLWRILLDNDFTILRRDKVLLSVPTLVLVVLLCASFGLMLVVLIAGLFCGCQYRFEGRQLGKRGINSAMEQMSDVAEDIKENFQRRNDGE